MNAIYLLPLGDADRTVLTEVRQPLSETFHATVELKECDLNLARFYDEGRLQYNSTQIIRFLQDQYRQIVGQSGEGDPPPKLLAVSGEDLFIPILTYVFGEAQLGGSCAVVSYHRLQNERYGLPPDEELLLARLTKEAVHEMGHAFGLIHCASQECVMHISTYVEDIDLKGDTLCSRCAGEIDSKL